MIHATVYPFKNIHLFQYTFVTMASPFLPIRLPDLCFAIVDFNQCKYTACNMLYILLHPLFGNCLR